MTNKSTAFDLDPAPVLTDPVPAAETAPTADPALELPIDPTLPPSGPDGLPPAAVDPGADIEPAPALDLSRLSYLERYIELMNSPGYRAKLLNYLRDTAGLEVIEDDDGTANSTTLDMAGVCIDPAPDVATALSNCAAAARRAIAAAVA